MLVAEQQFRRIIAYRDLAKLVIAIERHATRVAANNRGPHPFTESDTHPAQEEPLTVTV
jgi:hypothetical protein